MNQEKKGGMLRLYEVLRDAVVTRRAVRFYEEQGLLLPAGRDQYGRRVYVHSDLMRLKLIRALRTAGLSIAAIRDVLDARAMRTNDSSSMTWVERVEQVLLQHGEALRLQLLAMQQGEREMISAVSWFQEHRMDTTTPEAAAEDPAVPFIVRALFCQPSTLSTAPVVSRTPVVREEGLSFTPTW